jgi:hypothetical protein
MKALIYIYRHTRISRKIQNSYAYTEEKELNACIGRRNVLRNISIYKLVMTWPHGSSVNGIQE